MSRARALVPALVVPDEQTWTISGRDPARMGLEPVFAAARVRRVLAPEHVPDGLTDALAAFLERVPPDVGRPARPSHDERGVHPDDGGEDEDGHADHDHDDMMAIVGDPSADGLVMESLELRFGPIGTPLPGGLVADVTLDGDVVASCEVAGLLTADDRAAVPDPLAPQAWRAALAGAAGDAAGAPAERWNRIARVEVERALSHTAWLRAFARLLGWPALIDRAGRAVALALDARRLTEPALRDARDELAGLAGHLARSRALRWRAAGRAPVSADRARALGLCGPAGRASGLDDDARSHDRLYRRLGFEAVVRSEGDARARTLVRAFEAPAALELAARALEEAGSPAPANGGTVEGPPGPVVTRVEGPRGPVVARVDGPRRLVSAPGQEAARAAAGESAVGAEWAAALVGLASFDLSPWQVSA